MRPVPSSVSAVITGASSGIGAEFARQLASRGHDITITARRMDRLTRLANTLRAQYHVNVTILEADLEQPEGLSTVSTYLQQGGPWILINNAGFGTKGSFANLDITREQAEIAVNVTAVQALTAAALPRCIDAAEGGIINVASTAAFQPLPYMATYAATKAFVLAFTEALAFETRNTGVRMMALCPGPVKTEFTDVVGAQHDHSRLSSARHISVERCVQVALAGFDRGRTVVIPGWSNVLTAQVPRLTPRALVRQVAGNFTAPRTK